MDELEKNELDVDVNESTDVSTEPDSSADGLKKELEEIRDMFQQAIDSAAQEESEGEVIQELEDIESDDSEELAAGQERPLCECCGEKPSSSLYGEDYLYCDDCRELMKHYPLRIGGVIAVLVMIAVFALTAYFGYGNLEKSIKVLEAQATFREGKMISTLDALYDYISVSDEDSNKISTLLVEAFCRSGYISDAKTYIENNFTSDELKNPLNKKYKETLNRIDAFITTQDATREIVYDAFRGADFNYDELSAMLDTVKDSYIDEEKGIKYEAVLTEYYKTELMELKNMDLELQLETLKAIEESDKDGFYGWIYNPSLCEISAKMGDKEATERYFEKMKKINSEDQTAYRAYASYYRFLETPDADEMIKIAQQAKENARYGDSSYCTILATAYLLKGEGSLALDTMKEYMSSNRYSVPDCNLFALCALYCGDTDTYETMKVTLQNSGYNISTLVENYKNGTMSVAEVLSDKGGDL